MKSKLYSKYINDNLKYERVKLNYSYKEMAEKLGFKSATSYSNIENGVVKPNIVTMNRISEIFKKPVSYFFNIEFNKIEQNEKH